MIKFVTTNPRHYRPICLMNIIDVGFEKFGLLKCQFTIEYKGNWQNFDKRQMVRTNFFFELKKNVQDLGIVFEQTIQPVKITKEIL
jgi:hypothetical protein